MSLQSRNDVSFECVDTTNLSAIEKDWRALEQRSNSSFFQTWSWIGAWLQQIALPFSPVVIRVFSAAELVGIGILVPHKLFRRKIFQRHLLYLNEIPVKRKNMVIEYNGLLAQSGYEEYVYSNAAQAIFHSKIAYDEISIGGIRKKDLTLLEACSGQFNLIVDDQSISRQVSLDKIGSGIDGVLASLSKNRRYQIRQSIKAYSVHGQISISCADTLEETLEAFHKLGRFHTARWQQVNKPGVFSNPDWVRFHEALIKTCFPLGQVELLTISNREQVIGYLYNFLWKDRVYVLQTGFSLTQDNKQQPGYVSHVFAIDFYKHKGKKIYDLLHGEATYKKILCDAEEELFWCCLQRPTMSHYLENSAVSLVRKMRGNQ